MNSVSKLIASAAVSLLAAGCGSPLTAQNTDAGPCGPAVDMGPGGSQREGGGSPADHRSSIDAAMVTTTTISALRASPPSSSGAAFSIPSATMIVAQGSAGKWKGYVQDTGTADGIELYCSSTSKTHACSLATVAGGMNLSLTGIWDGYMGLDELIPTAMTASGAGTITYANGVASTAVAESNVSGAAMYFGAPVHLDPAAGPWMVTNLAPPALMNKSYVAGGCTKGPQYFGFEVTAVDGVTKLLVTTDWYRTITFATDSNCSGAGTTVLTTSNVFNSLGGIVEEDNPGASPVVVIEPFNSADYSFM